MDVKSELRRFIPFFAISSLLFLIAVTIYGLFGYAKINIPDKDAVVFINNKQFTQSEDDSIKVRPGDYTIKVVSPTKEYIDTKKLYPFTSQTITLNQINDYSPILDNALNSTSYEYTNVTVTENKWLTACASNRESGVIIALYFDSGAWLPVAINDTENDKSVASLQSILPQVVLNSVIGCRR